MNNNIISFDQVSKRYKGNIVAVENISLHVDHGELVFLSGHSGAGKSTILKLIAGIEPATEGKVVVNGFDLSKIKLSHRTFIRQHIGFIFQNHNILFDRNVFANVSLPLEILGYNSKTIKERVLRAISSVGLEHKFTALPQQLSGGEQQRLCIARAIVHRPKILLADEPTANLDKDNAFKILELFKEFHTSGITIIISAHDENILNDYGKRIIRLSHGKFEG
jgi:cell division transport system ATP-binding protein